MATKLTDLVKEVMAKIMVKPKPILAIRPELKAEVFRAARDTHQSASRFTRQALRAEVARARAQREKALMAKEKPENGTGDPRLDAMLARVAAKVAEMEAQRAPESASEASPRGARARGYGWSRPRTGRSPRKRSGR